MRREIWVPMLTAWQALTRPREVASEVRDYCARMSKLRDDYARHEYVLQEQNQLLRASLAEVEADNKRLRASHGAWALRVQSGGVS